MAAELGLLHLGSRPLPEVGPLARRVEDLGYDTLWISDEKFYRDPFVSLTVAAQATSRLRLGTGVTEPYARHPALIAMAMGSLAELCPGRCRIGLGAGGPGFPPLGVERRKPAQAMREAVAILRGLLAGERVTVAGEVIRFLGGSLNFPTQPLPIYVAARGQRMLCTAGAIADGVIMAPFASEQALAQASAWVRAGARQAGRTDGGPRLVARVDVCVARRRETARRAVRYFVALPVWVSYPDWSYVEAVGIALPDALRSLIARREYGDIAAAGELLPEAMIDHFAVAGTEAEAAEQLARIARCVDEVVVHPVASEDWGIDDVIRWVARVWRQLP
jgi:5,10-methylenetetrahydromethanopterin reductase